MTGIVRTPVAGGVGSNANILIGTLVFVVLEKIRFDAKGKAEATMFQSFEQFAKREKAEVSVRQSI